VTSRVQNGVSMAQASQSKTSDEKSVRDFFVESLINSAKSIASSGKIKVSIAATGTKCSNKA
jgi:hypothetical protein